MKLTKLSRAIALSFSCSVSFSALADDGVTVVSASALNKLVQTQINSETLEQKQASDMKDVLNTMPSVTVDGNSRYSRKVFIRGMEDKFAVVSIDGARQEGQLFHHTGDQNIDPALLKVAGIELGGTSVLSGMGAINGSFRYETKDPEDLLAEGENFGARVKTSYQSAYERKGGEVAVYAKLNDKLQFMGIANYAEDDDLHIPNKPDVASKQGALKSGMAKVIFIPNDNNKFKLTLNRYSDGGKRQLSGEKPGNHVDGEDYSSINRDTVSLQHAYNPDSALVKLKADLYYNRQYMNRDALTEGYGDWKKVDGKWYFTKDGDLSIAEREYNVTTIGGDIRNISWVGEHELTYGLEGYKAKQWVDADDAKYTGGSKDGQVKVYDVDGGTITAYGLYLQDMFEINDFRLTTGLRYDTHKLGGVYSGSFDQLSPKFNGEYQATNDLMLRIGYGRLFKGAALPETLMLSPTTGKDQANTKAMIGNNYEAGFEYDLSNILAVDSAMLGFTAFQYNLDNQMHPTKNTSLDGDYDVEIWGVETVFTYSLAGLDIYANHSYSDGEQTNLKDGAVNDMDKTGIHNFKAGLKYQANDELVLGWDSRFVPGNSHKSEDKDDGDVERAGFATHNAWVAYNPVAVENLTLNVGIDNIFDKQYAEHTGFGISWGNNKYTSYEAGRNFKASVAYKF